jgi:hypothetical protein
MKARIALLLVLPITLAGCGGDDGDDDAKEPARPQASTQPGTDERTPEKRGKRRRRERESADRGAKKVASPAPKPPNLPPIELPVHILRGRIVPPIVVVPPRQRVRLILRTLDSRSHTVELRAPGAGSVTVRRGGSATLRVPPKLRRGRYPLVVDGRRTQATVRVLG